MRPDSAINPLTAERETGRARFCRNAIIIRLSTMEADAYEFARARGYLPDVGGVVYYDHKPPVFRILRADAYAWAEAAEDDPDAFTACLARPLAALFHAADFHIRDGWAV